MICLSFVCILLPSWSLALSINDDYFELDRRVTDGRNAHPSLIAVRSELHLELYLAKEVETVEKRDFLKEILLTELENAFERMHIILYQDPDTENNEKEKALLKSAVLSYGFARCDEGDDCIKGYRYSIKFLTNADKSGLEIFDEFVDKYKYLIIFLIPALILRILKRKARTKV